MSIVLSDGHTTLDEAMEVADECHEYAEELANSCDDSTATVLSKAGAILQMLVVKLRAYSPDEPCAISATVADVEKFDQLREQCQCMWRSDVTLICRLPKGHEGDHREGRFTWNGPIDARAGQPPGADQLDAERYRWLKSAGNVVGGVPFVAVEDRGLRELSGDAVDQAIDRARGVNHGT